MKELIQMKNKILTLLAAVGLIASFSACDNTNLEPISDSFGKLSFAEFGVTVDESQAAVESRATTQKQDVNSYLVTIINTKSGKPVTGYNDKKFSELPGVVDLEVGKYEIIVESHNPGKVEYDRPYYTGSKEVEIVENKITNAESVVCKFNSVRVSVTYSEKLTQLLDLDENPDVQVNISYGNGAMAVFSYSSDKNKNSDKTSAYFAPVEGANTLIATIRGTINGQSVEQTKTYSDIKPGHHYTIRFKVMGPQDTGEETGMITPGEGIKIDTSIITTGEDGNVKVVEDILNDDDRPGKEDPDPNETPDDPNPPTPPVGDDQTGDVKITSNDLKLDEPNYTADVEKAIVNIHADSGLEHLYLEVESTNTDFAETIELMFGKDKYDFAYPPEETTSSLDQLNLKYGEDILGKHDVVFDITTFIPMLDHIPGFPGTHTFKLTAVSKNGQETKSLIFIAK